MLKTVYDLETALLRAQRREEALQEAIQQARFHLRQAKITQVEYGGIRALLDKLSGKHADKEEALARNVRKAEAELSLLKRKLETEQQKLSILNQQRTGFPPVAQLRTGENEALWAKLESRYCADSLLPLLDQVEEALTEYRQMLRGEIPMLSITEQQAIGAAPIKLAEECRPLLQRLEIAQADLQPGEFFRSPAAFLAAAARHNQLDRAMAAATQTEQLLAQLSRFREK